MFMSVSDVFEGRSFFAAYRCLSDMRPAPVVIAQLFLIVTGRLITVTMSMTW